MVDISLICDDAYVLPTLVTIQSIIDSYDSRCGLVNIHVCSFSLLSSNEQMLTEMSNENVKVVVHIFNDNVFNVETVVSKTHVSKVALIKFELPNLFQDIDCMLYLDSDVIVKKNFFDLFLVDIDDCYLAASYELWKYLEELRFCPSRLKKNIFYFNSGVMLLNLKKMREDSITTQLWDYKLNHAKTKLMDQESFNAVCGLKTQPLSIKWNFNPVFNSEEYLPIINRKYSERYSKLNDLVDDVRIIHYVGKADKPWIYKKAKMRSFWDAYYNNCKKVPPLFLKDYLSPRKNLFQKISEITSCYGLWGLFNFIKFRMIGNLK